MSGNRRDFTSRLAAFFGTSLVCATFAFILGISAPTSASAAALVVTRVDDRNIACVSGVDCSLREAVSAANATLATDDTITFVIPPSNCPTTPVCTITLGSEILIDGAGGALTITGSGANQLTIDGGPGSNRIFSTNGGTFTLTRLTLTGGDGGGAANNNVGGAFLINGGTFIMDGVHVTGNTAFNGFATAGGGLISGGVNHQISNSTFSANNANFCGAFVIEAGGSITFTNTTFSGNSAVTAGGGAMCIDGSDVVFSSSTIVSNSTADVGGGMSIDNGANITFRNTIVAANSAVNGDADIFLGVGASPTITSSGFNLIGDNASVAVQFPAGNPNANKDIVGTTASPIDPLLAALADNGGPNRVPTRAVTSGSPGLDKGFSFGLTTDERGVVRPTDFPTVPNQGGGDGSDIGAFELLAPSAASVSISGRVTTSSGRAVGGATIQLSDGSSTVQAMTSPFGYYQFDGVSAGDSYVLSVSAKRYTFVPRLVSINDKITEFDFVAEP